MQPIYDFIDDENNRPFFLWYAPFLPHRPHNPPERLLNKYQERTDSIYLARFWANCEWFDETCGALLKYLEKSGNSENTIIFYVCDNGWIQQSDKKSYAKRSKTSPYEGGIRTPIMIKWPGHITPKTDNTTLVSSIDLAPTILSACGQESIKNMQGVNLLDSDALKKRNTIFGAAFTHDAVDIDKPLTSLQYTFAIEGEWKLIQPSGRNGTGTKPELYNVVKDPNESIDLADTNIEIVEYMRNQIKEWWMEAVPE
jgi:uncharacterized sulfatase